MSLRHAILGSLVNAAEGMTPLEVTRDVLDQEDEFEELDESLLKPMVTGELDELADEGLVDKQGRRYYVTAAGEEEYEEASRPPRVFLVHGHDHRLLYECKALIEREFKDDTGDVIVLEEQASRGSESLFDKFKRHAPKPGDLAVALLTADDVGGEDRPRRDLHPRARQNVILELGYCYGVIGRERTWVLLEQSVEQPSDILGSMYIAAEGNWKMTLRDGIREVLDEE